MTEEGARTPFGAELFNGGFRGVRGDGMNPEYRMQPGDQVTLRIWGAVQIDRVIPVDAQGNLFIPSIGPVQVSGVSQAQLDNLVRAKVREFYPDNVFVYTNLQGRTACFGLCYRFCKTSGAIRRIPADSVLHFLDQAGGVDEQLGSYRRISIKRNDTIVASIDLYQFCRLAS
ncbi:polysaccharide biosynthesis/export family protein [Alishewanella longhuensis]